MNCGIYNQLLLDYYWATTGLLQGYYWITTGLLLGYYWFLVTP